MKFNCILEKLKESVILTERSSSRSQNLPVLSSVFMDAQNNGVILRSTNLETALEINIPAQVEQPGSIAVSAKVLSSFLSNVKGDKATLEAKKDNLLVKTAKTQTTIRGYPKEDFPIFPKIKDELSFVIPSYELSTAIDNTISAASISDIKPELSSLFFKMYKNTVKIAATDSFRLAEKNIIHKTLSFENLISILLPSRSAVEIPRIFKSNKDLKISFNRNQIVVSDDSARFIARLVEGVFPDYEQIIPKSFKTEVVLNKNDILHQIKLASVFTGKLNDISLSFSPNDKKVIFSVSNQDIGEHSSSLEGKLKGEEIELKFNWRYLIEGISQVNTENIVLSLNNNQSPMLIRGENDASFMYLAMPMKGV